jgi:hypothetical protein
MKKIFTLIVLAGLTLSAAAQLESGFYRIQNVTSQRYIVMYDPYVLVNKATGTVNLDALQTIYDFKKVRSHMGSVWYMEDKGNSQYDLHCQHSSLGANSDGFYPKLWATGDSYRIYGEYSGFTKYLYDMDDMYDDGYVSIVQSDNISWQFVPIGGDNYVGIAPEVSADGHYWATFMSGFPFTLGSGMKAYKVTNITDHGFAMEEIGSEIPAKMPVLIRLNGSSPSENRITIKKNSSASVSGNLLYGVWYSSELGGRHEDYNVSCDSNKRILGKSGGRLAFVKGSGLIEHNRGYIEVSSNADEAIIESTSGIYSVTKEEVTEKGLYTLTGLKVPDGTTPSSGIYIKDGKKVIIK